MTAFLGRVELPAGPLRIPLGCAGCGAAAACSKAELLGAGSAIIYYCERCLMLVNRAATMRLSVLLAQGLSAGSAAAFLPLLGPWLTPVALAAWVTVGWGLPHAAAQAIAHGQSGILRYGRAVFRDSKTSAVGTCSTWLEQLAELNASAWQPISGWRTLRLDLVKRLGLLVIALLMASWVYRFTHPEVRVLNLLERPLQVAVDGHPIVVNLPPHSGESPRAGVKVRVPAGSFDWVATSAGQTVERARHRTTPGAQHLYAPGRHNHCFWLETTAYAVGSPGGPPSQPLPLHQGFSRLERPVDGWFSVPVPAAEAPLPATGGQLTILRQARCDAPTNFDPPRAPVLLP